MATSTILNKPTAKLGSINQYDFSQVSIEQKNGNNVKINEFLPFRIRITDKDIIGFGPNNTPPITLQIIGISNYIL